MIEEKAMHFLQFQAVYLFWCIVFAGINTSWIKNHMHVLHGFTGWAHIFTAVAAGFLFGRWECVLIILCNARIIYSTTLNIFRGLRFDYVSPKPKSIVDRVEKWAFQDRGWMALLIYIVTTIICNASYLQHYSE